MASDDHDLLGVCGAADFAYYIRTWNWSVRETILDIQVQTRSSATFDIAFQLALIFSGHADHRNLKQDIDTEHSGVGQMHARSPCSSLATDHPKRTGVIGVSQEVAKFGSRGQAISRRLSFLDEQQDFTTP